ncbi:hypothetical protein [Paludisphaera soli]|uniref:hypothetical protein n=1 Tax=Paludisphaera soli TaxID=2712865 RepID=UPI0013EAEA75|nr:hypothetical protein [Paludisphaera soli]
MTTNASPAAALGALACCLAFAASATAADFPMARWDLRSSIQSEAVDEAVRHFRERVHALGGPESADGGLEVVVSEDAGDAAFAGLADFEREEGYLIEADGPGKLSVRVAGAAGAVHAVSNLETRLRANSEGVRLAFPEWGEGDARRLVEKPAIATRGEYLNIGYDLAGITPHQWDAARWRWYVDRLVLSRLNRWYVYLWIDSQTMFPGSELSKRPVNARLHEGVREAIRYARRRGLKVTFMVSPTMLPRDLWEAHPEWKADISYARHGFACVCPNAPGAWEQMKAVWRSELEWFREVDAIQVWFYDPGGCWCERYGCKPNQVDSLVRQVREFGAMYRELNPDGEIEYNLWPVNLWEAEMKVEVREGLARRLQAESPPGAAPLTMIGMVEGSPAPVPDLERSLGMRGGTFLFAANPESSYVFPTPHLDYFRRTAQAVRRNGLEVAFGHRLEAATRDSSTFLMGQWFWDPDLSTHRVLRRLTDWQTGDEAAGERLAEAVVVLDELTAKGITVEAARKLGDLLDELPPGMPPACREDLEYWPAAASALRAIGESLDAEGPDLDPYEKKFAEALSRSRAFAPLVPRAGSLFRSYRGFLRTGWEKACF